MKKLLLTIADRMEPGIIENLIRRLGSQTPRMFQIARLWSLFGAAGCTAAIEGLQNNVVPPFKYEGLVLHALQFLAAFMSAFVLAFSLHTSDQAVHEESNRTA